MENQQVVTVAVKKAFKDGMLMQDFQKLGYPVVWLPGRYRILPVDLAQRAMDSGAEITFPPPGSREDFIRLVAPAAPRSEEYREQAAKENQANDPTVRVVFPKGYRNGALAPEFAVIDHPAWFGVGEIAVLPTSLYEALEKDGAPMSRDKDMLRDYEPHQGKHQVKVEKWRAERDEAKTLLAESKANAANNARILAKIEELSIRFNKATGKATKEALWNRIEDLQKELK